MNLLYARRKQTSKALPDGGWHIVMAPPNLPKGKMMSEWPDSTYEALRAYRQWQMKLRPSIHLKVLAPTGGWHGWVSGVL